MLSYIGGKSKIGKWIRNYIPSDIEIYCETFSGMYWVFFNLELPNYRNLKKIVYNDFNPLNVNLFNCVRNYREFYEIIKNVESQDGELFRKFQSEIFSPDFKVDLSKPDYETGYKYAYILTQVWSGTNPEKGSFIDLKGKYKSKFDTFKDKLVNPKWQNYFSMIDVVENLDFQEVVEKYDSPKTYFYCDPPYHKTENYYANHEFGIDTHKRLADCLKKIQGKFSLSYYDFDELSVWFPKDQYRWESKSFAKAAMAKAGQEQTKGVELLIMNYGKNQDME
jgi:DNA adenine methylase